jgi:hypothetical protein
VAPVGILPQVPLQKERFPGKRLLNIKCVFGVSIQLLSEIFFIAKRIERDMIKMYIGLHVKFPLFLSDFNET